MVTENQNENDWIYEPNLIDLRFLKAVDYIIRKNKTANIKPDTDSLISKMIYGRENIIKEIRNFQRGIVIPELHKFANYFNLDFNYFFRGKEPMIYNQGAVTDKLNNIPNSSIDIVGNMEGNNVYRGTVYNGDIHIGTKIIKVEKIIFL